MRISQTPVLFFQDLSGRGKGKRQEKHETKQIKNINIEELPEEIKDGTVLKCINGKFFLDKETEEEISKRIEEKMNRLWN